MSSVQPAGKRILYPEANGMLPWPDDWTTRYFASNVPCDMLVGPCACGSSHIREQWPGVLNFYNAEIRDRPRLGIDPGVRPATLYYF